MSSEEEARSQTEKEKQEQKVKNERRKRERRIKHFTKVSFSFWVFVLIAAPLDIHYQWINLFYFDETDWVEKFLKSGAIYFYAIILSMESHLRVSNTYLTEKERKKLDMSIFTMKWLLLVPILIFIIQFFVSPYYRTNTNIPEAERIVQLGTGFLAILLSYIVNHSVLKQETSKIR